MIDLSKVLVGPETQIRDAIACIDRNTQGVVLVVDEDRRLIGTVTDGDIRRAILASTSLDLPVQSLLEGRETPPFTAPSGTSEAELLRLMNEHTVRHIPLLDEQGRVVDMAALWSLVKEYDLPLTAVVMAGGFGTRLRPLTEQTPKSMLPIGGEPLLAIIIKQLRECGIRRLNVITHYKGDVIMNHFRDGRDFGVDINYVEEDCPLGTAGGLSLTQAPDQPLLVINGDILTTVDFRAMLDFHRDHGAELTVAVREFEVQIPYGVVDSVGVTVTGISEKPVYRYFINAGLYLLDARVCLDLPSGARMDMTELIARLLAQKRRVVTFPVLEYWRDIGRVEDYRQAIADVEKKTMV